MIFFLINLTPSSPGVIALGADASQEAVDAYNESVGYTANYFGRYFNWLSGMVKGNFGTSYYPSVYTIQQQIAARFPVSLKLALFGVALSILLGLPLGVFCAVKRNSFLDRAVSSVSVFIASFPVFFFAIILIILFSQKLGLVPSSGLSGDPKDWILPVATQGITSMVTYVRYTRSSMLDSLQEDYIRTARAKGASERSTILGDALRNALMPVITFAGISMGHALGGSVVIEKTFSLGSLFTQADIPFSKAQTWDEVLADPQAWENNCFVSRKYANGTSRTLVRPPVQLGDTEIPAYPRGPYLGEDTDQVLLEYGFTQVEINTFREHGDVK